MLKAALRIDEATMSTYLTSRARVPTPKQLNSVGVKKDEFETFWHILVTYCQQDAGYLDFFQGGQYDKWEALSSNPTRGISVQPDVNEMMIDQGQAVRDANTKSVQIRASLNSLLTTIAAYCPDGLFKTILTDSTSIAWIRNRLAQVCNIETSGRHLPKILEIKYNRGEESPAAFMERIKSSFMDSLVPAGTRYHGTLLATPETMSPTFESLIIIQCLKAIHPDLPDFIMNNKGMLFTTNTPNFCDIQQEICDTMDTLLAQMEAQNSIQRMQVVDASTYSTSEALRWSNTASRGKPHSYRGASAMSSGGASRPAPGRQQVTKKTCDYCLALGKDEKIWSTHDKMNCYDLFPEKRRNRVNARLLSVPVMTDENDTWDLQDALNTVENQFYNQASLESEEHSAAVDYSPQ